MNTEKIWWLKIEVDSRLGNLFCYHFGANFRPKMLTLTSEFQRMYASQVIKLLLIILEFSMRSPVMLQMLVIHHFPRSLLNTLL